MQIKGATFHTSKHLEDRELLVPDNRCPFCGSVDRKRAGVIQESPVVNLLECGKCFAASVDRMPTEDALGRYYGAWYTDDIHKDAAVTFDGVSRFGRHLVELAVGHLSPDPSIIDFGGGDGSLAYSVAEMLRSRGAEHVHIHVVDVNSRIVQSRDEHIFVSHHTNLEAVGDPPKPGAYDLVIASAIIEHLTRPKEILEKLLYLGRCFYARTPHVLPLMNLSKRFGVNWDFSFPGHVHDLGQEFWEHYFNDIGFELLRSKPAIVEASFDTHPVRAAISHVLKAPWYLLGKRYQLVGGWEVFAKRSGALPVPSH